jgi:hypothetical protein
MDYGNVNTSSISDAPAHWTGPHMWKNLKTLIRDDTTNKPLLFDTFEEALAVANKNDDCSGITQSDKGYRLFKGSALVTNPENTKSAIASWVKESKYKSRKTKKKMFNVLPKKKKSSSFIDSFVSIFNTGISNHKINTSSISDAPEHWTGPHMWKNLKTLIRDDTTNKPLLFDTFEEALAVANKNDDCSGITQSDKGYRLFKGSALVTNPENTKSAIASWVKESKYKSRKTKKNTFIVSNNSRNHSKRKNGNNSEKMSKKVNSNSIVQHNWVNDAFKDNKFRIIETRSNGDCFFDSVRLGLPTAHKKTVKQIRQLLVPYLTHDIFERDLGLYTSAKEEKHKSIIEKDKVMKNTSSKKRDKLNKLESDLDGINEIINEWTFFDRFKIDSLDKYKTFILNNNYWANSWSLSILEKELNIKLIILSERSYIEGDNYNILQCGDFEAMDDSIPSCIECGMTQREREFLDSDGLDDMKIEIYKNALFNHSIDITEDDTIDILKLKYLQLPDSHKFVDKEEVFEEYIPHGYIIITYSGNHYRLVSYNNINFFKTLDELPESLVVQIKRKCNNVGLYKRIKDVGL